VNAVLSTLRVVTTQLRLVQSAKALAPREVTEEGMVMDLRAEQSAKAIEPITFTEEGKVTELSALQE